MKPDETCRCGKPAVAKGTLYRSLRSAKPEHPWMCLGHYLECQFGLWPYTCTKACEKVRRKASDCAQLGETDFLTWIPLDMMASTRTMRPTCPWCTRKLRPYPPKPKGGKTKTV